MGGKPPEKSPGKNPRGQVGLQTQSTYTPRIRTRDARGERRVKNHYANPTAPAQRAHEMHFMLYYARVVCPLVVLQSEAEVKSEGAIHIPVAGVCVMCHTGPVGRKC